MSAKCWDCGGEDTPCFCCRCRDRWPLLTVVDLKSQSQILAHEEGLREELQRAVLVREQEATHEVRWFRELELHRAEREIARLDAAYTNALADLKAKSDDLDQYRGEIDRLREALTRLRTAATASDALLSLVRHRHRISMIPDDLVCEIDEVIGQTRAALAHAEEVSREA